MSKSQNDSPLFFRRFFGTRPQKTFVLVNEISECARWAHCSKDHNIRGFQDKHRRKNVRDAKYVFSNSRKLHHFIFQVA